MGICSSKNKITTPIQKVSSFPKKKSQIPKSLTSKCKDYLVNKEELILIQLIYSDLARRSSASCMTKESFFLVFFLPVHLMQGLLGERLFDFFDSQKKQQLGLENFLHGVAEFSRSSPERRQRIIFDICDIKDDHVLDMNELKIMVTFMQLHMLGVEILTKPFFNNNSVAPAIRSKE